jgi:TPP-dependent pyruvate/acetoin dehydrogenase alpha subunit
MRTESDCILAMRNRMIEAGFATEEELKVGPAGPSPQKAPSTEPPMPTGRLVQETEKEVRNQVTQEAEEALAAPPTPLDQLTKHIYAEVRRARRVGKNHATGPRCSSARMLRPGHQGRARL